MTARATTFGALVLAMALAGPAQAALKFSSGCGGNFPCAELTVPLDRSGEVPGEVRLSIERVRNGTAKRASGAVFALAGGPGQAGSSVAEAFNADLFGAIGARDLIVVDQRGTGRSGALDCPELDGAPSDRPADARTAICARRLGARRSFYTTEDTVADLEAVRAALGIERITLYGVSYGTKVALTYAARHPEHVERLVLDSVVDPAGQSPFDLDSFAALPAVLDEMCRGECDGVTGSLSADVAALAARMPIRGPVVDPSGRRVTRTVTARDLYGRIRAGDTLAEARVDYPGAIRAALDGDPAPLVRLEHGGRLGAAAVTSRRSFADVLSFTLQAATLCEEAPLPWERFAAPAERDAQARAAAEAVPDAAFAPFHREVALFPDANNLLLQCRRWPAAPLRAAPPALGELPDVPALVLGGREDVRTPLAIGERVAAAFPRGQVVAVPKTGHSVLAGAACAREAVERFFADRPLGDPCAGLRRSVSIRPVPPASLDAVPGGSLAKRTLAAVRLTLRDLRALTAFGTRRGGGLRAGAYVAGRDGVRLRGFSYVPGVALSGRVAVGGRRSGPLRVGGGAATPLTVRLRDGKLRVR